MFTENQRMTSQIPHLASGQVVRGAIVFCRIQMRTYYGISRAWSEFLAVSFDHAPSSSAARHGTALLRLVKV